MPTFLPHICFNCFCLYSMGSPKQIRPATPALASTRAPKETGRVIPTVLFLFFYFFLFLPRVKQVPLRILSPLFIFGWHGWALRLICGGTRLFSRSPFPPKFTYRKRTKGLLSEAGSCEDNESVGPRDGWYGLPVPRERQLPGTIPFGSDAHSLRHRGQRH